ncbi:hypothetical protein [Burkholderia stabilis]|uniref:hypothetical protein n=1 Tax=Burkholderia stabilis TaxID=95485 RepID=UPI001FC810AD|nr:hypothetical protein [Burkholderia stabilis]
MHARHRRIPDDRVAARGIAAEHVIRAEQAHFSGRIILEYRHDRPVSDSPGSPESRIGAAGQAIDSLIANNVECSPPHYLFFRPLPFKSLPVRCALFHPVELSAALLF